MPWVASWLVAQTVYADLVLKEAQILFALLRELHMTALRNKSERTAFRPQHDYVVEYSEDVTKEQVRKLDEIVRKERETGNWVTVEQES
jgi:hypothetical protein